VNQNLSYRFVAIALLVGFGAAASAAPPTPAGRTPLPQKHAYQRILRDYLGTLQESDFAHGVTAPLADAQVSDDPEYRYRTYMMTFMHQPLIGWKRGTPAVNAPPRLFLLSSIEGPPTPDTPPPAPLPLPDPPPTVFTPVDVPTPTGIVVPPVWPETLAAFVEWNHPGNPYFGNVPLLRRAFVTATVHLIMLDEHLESVPDNHGATQNAVHLISLGATYPSVEKLLPAEVQKAYQEGLLRLGRRVLSWGTKNSGHSPAAAVGLLYTSRAIDDAAFAAEIEAFVRRTFTDAQFLHPAGYWIDGGKGVDVGFGGTSNFYAIWAALMTDQPFVRETVERNYRLRAHLCFPEPNGTLTGPSQFNARLGTPACGDQWHWDGARERAAAMLTDEAAHLLKRLAPEDLAAAAPDRIRWFNFQIKQNPVRPDLYGRKSALKTGYWKNDELQGRTWTWRPYYSYNFPATVNVAYQFYRPGAYARRKQLEESDSPCLRSPYQREETFVRNFGDAFVAAKQKNYAVLLHTGPVGKGSPESPCEEGFGGGQLAAFWTPASGPVLLGRRMGQGNDKLEMWRQWPIHAVSGCTSDGRVISSAQIARPEVEVETAAERTTVSTRGSVALAKAGSKLDYRRKFEIEPTGLRVTTTAVCGGREQLAELYETLPVFLHDQRRPPLPQPTEIEFRVADRWMPATAEFAEDVSAVRLHRFEGSVLWTFERPERVKLAPEVWSDTSLTKATCRNVLIDLMNGHKADDAQTVSYFIQTESREN